MERNLEYADSLYNREELKYFAEEYLKRLPWDTTHLISMGSSGCAIASAVLVLSPFPLHHISIRKSPRESSHSPEYAGELDRCETDKMVIVDDIVATGHTIRMMMEWAEKKGLKIHSVLVWEENGSLFKLRESKFRPVIREVKKDGKEAIWYEDQEASTEPAWKDTDSKDYI